MVLGENFRCHELHIVSVLFGIKKWMGRICRMFYVSLCLLLCCLPQSFSVSDSVTPNFSIRDGQTLVSKGKIFEMGFFSSGEGSNRCVGIWYAQLAIRRIVWVANGDNPVNDSSGVLTIEGDGNLVLFDGHRKTLWSTNASTVSNNSVAVLLDSGNLVLRGGSDPAQRLVWQSFDFPTDTLLPGMKIGFNRRTRKTQKLISWKDDKDPSSGTFSFGIDPQELRQFFIFKGLEPYYRSIYWNGTTYKLLPEQSQALVNFTVISNENGVFLEYSASLTFLPSIVMDPSGKLNYIWYVGTGDSITEESHVWSGQAHSCEEFGACGIFSSCNQNQSPMCQCLPGFEPASARDWNSGDWSGGCRRKKPLQCRNKDEFLVLPRMKLAPPETDEGSTNTGVEACTAQCLRNCSCTAYANVKSGGNFTCQIWNEDLQDVKDGNEGDGEAVDLYLRLAASELENTGRRCQTCGTNIIPYPLSTGPNCGDPAYNSFSCNSTAGQLRFNALDGSSYAITSINTELRTFVIQPEDMHICWPNGAKSKDVLLNNRLPFYLTNRSSVLLFDCAAPQLSVTLNCTSTLCEKYIYDGPAACINSSMCCSQMAEGLSAPKSYSIGVLHTGCSAYASIVNANLSSPASNWQVGVEIGWEPPLEPVCNSSSDCRAWANSTCLFVGGQRGTKRCICNSNLKWNPLTLNCTKDNIRNKGLEASSHSRKHLATIIPITIVHVFLLASVLTFCLWRRRRRVVRKKEAKHKRSRMSSSHLGGKDILGANGTEELDIPFFDFESVAAATGGFSESNKLGQGGFGPVYKGKQPGGQEIAVKRLSQRSGQGLEEFKNEVMLIAKLQHRNLVRLLGYCIAGDEKMIIYEYLPNKSLDFFIFEKNRCRLLDWKMRFNIILGIARGLLYLHQDSRLRIIHRDLKSGNVLLDEEMNPKISDFGMARLFGGNQLEANTNRVVGTYGYMSPEYALHGRFSVKSDVYSFGIIVLEIVSGKKNTALYDSQESLTLLGLAWRLWNEGRGLDLIHPSLSETCSASEVLNCIRIGLLCVQEDAADRPNMASVITMLNNEATTLAAPKKPPFLTITTRNDATGEPSCISINDVTISTLDGR
ncbi:G-type lectin S-receptor-like serine/threonine-protein kinase At4g27290 isoform X2 [Aristolochia californica]|uniref:G-type lectin S-receptor-like serine/threonine-protein kinase At4g27290 isoform X2 n=1 Tax=Aristolochia californica TaxID=171875 RepID=UPI0035D981F0